MRYASTETFEGQRATIGRIVVICQSGLSAGIVDSIDDAGNVGIVPVDGTGGATFRLKFSPTHTIGDVENMADGTWTWPPRV